MRSVRVGAGDRQACGVGGQRVRSRRPRWTRNPPRCRLRGVLVPYPGIDQHPITLPHRFASSLERVFESCPPSCFILRGDPDKGSSRAFSDRRAAAHVRGALPWGMAPIPDPGLGQGTETPRHLAEGWARDRLLVTRPAEPCLAGNGSPQTCARATALQPAL